MKIAVIANLDKEISINTKGGSELFTYLQVQALAERPEVESIDVFALGQNYFTNEKIQFHSILPTSLREFIEKNRALNDLNSQRVDFFAQVEANIAIKLFLNLQNGHYDLIQNNSTSAIFNSLSPLLKTPLVTTLHTNANSPSIVIPYSLDLLSVQNKNSYFVAISNFQKKAIEKTGIVINTIATIYNGIDSNPYSLETNTSNQNPGLWIGRLSRKHNKGLKEAVEVSNLIHSKLTVLCSLDDNGYFEETIKPHLRPEIEIITESINVKQKAQYYSNSSYLLYPIMWEEPFGLIFLEAMVTGTPVIAFSRGAVPEIIVDGVTGFIVNPSDDDIRGDWIIKKTGIEGLAEAIKKLQSLSPEEYRKMRQACREHVENNFTIKKMVREYVETYKKIIG